MKKLAIILAVLLCASPLWAAIVIEDTCSLANTGAEPYDVTNCTVTGSNTYLACFVTNARNIAVTSVTWDTAGANQALSAIASTAATNAIRAAGVWYGLASPTAGTNKSVTVNMASGAVGLVSHCFGLSGVDQVAPVSGGATASTDNVTTLNVTVTSASGDLVFAGLVVNEEDGPDSLMVGADETLRLGPDLTLRATADENINVITMTQPGAASVSIDPTWTNTADGVLSGFSVKAATTARPIAPFIFQ